MYYYDQALENCCGPESGVSIGQYYREWLDRDGDRAVSEDFEWGDDGDSLDESLGEIEWTVEKLQTTGSVAEIDDDVYHGGSGQSARFYHDGAPYGLLRATYTEDYPTERKFYLKKDTNSVCYISTGCGTNRILVRVSSYKLWGTRYRDKVEYYHDGAWVSVYTRTHYDYSWYWLCIEFKNIDRVNADYDIWVNNYKRAGNVDMDDYSLGDGVTVYEACTQGTFWIDDILDTKGDYPDLPGDDNMFADLHDAMHTTGGGYTYPWNYGPGFEDMTEEYGYYNFEFDYDDDVNNDDADPADGMPDDFKDIVDAINAGHPVALGGNFPQGGDGGLISTDGNSNWPPSEGHYIAIKGYSYHRVDYMGYTFYSDFRILCTDSYSHANNLELDWDYIIENGYSFETIIIMD